MSFWLGHYKSLSERPARLELPHSIVHSAILGAPTICMGHEARHPCRGAERNLQHVVALWDYAHLEVVGLLVKTSEVAMRCRTS